MERIVLQSGAENHCCWNSPGLRESHGRARTLLVSKIFLFLCLVTWVILARGPGVSVLSFCWVPQTRQSVHWTGGWTALECLRKRVGEWGIWRADDENIAVYRTPVPQSLGNDKTFPGSVSDKCQGLPLVPGQMLTTAFSSQMFTA